MEDKEVKDKTVPVKAPENQKDLKKPTGKSATGKPLDGIDINPQLNDVSTNGNLLKIRKEDSVDLTAPVIQERKALTIPQRQKRARDLRAREPRMIRAREVAKTKLAPPSKIEQRALARARAIVKSRFSARKGVPYAELTTSEKIQVDTAVAKKTKLIKRIAARLLPRIRKAEFERLKSFRNGDKLQDLSTQSPNSQGIMPKMTEEMLELFNTLDVADTNSLIGIIENTIHQFNKDNNPLGEQLKKMLNAVLPEDVVTESLMKKSEKTGIPFSTLKEVFDRGEYSWDESNRMTQEQYAFARVNSYIAKGKAWHMDADLREEKVVNAKLDESFSDFMENYNYHVGLSGSTAKKREAHWKNMQKYSDKDPRAYQDAPGDKAARKKGMPQSEYTKKYHAMYGEDVEALINEAAAGLADKAKKSGVSLSVLKKVYARGVAAWNTGHRPGTTPQQWGMARVNSYISKGKGTYHGADKDLREAGPGLWANIHAKRERIKRGSGERMRKPGEKGAPTPEGLRSAQESVGTDKRKKIELVDRIPADQAAKARQAEIQKKIIDEAKGTPYVKPFHNEKGEHAGWKSSNGRNVKFWRLSDSAKKKAYQHAGISEDTAADREIGTDSLVKKYKKDTPGQKTNLDESFNMAWTSGIGVTLSAADCGIQIKAGFELHPDVVDQMAEIEEDVVAADKKPVYIKPRRHKDGSFGKSSTAMRRTGKKIIDVKEPEDVDSDEHDGK
jgi:lambda repressor-like predicted transcriptional regulator